MLSSKQTFPLNDLELSSGCMLLEPDLSPFFASQAYLSSLSRKWGCISYAFKPLDGVLHV